MAYIYLYALFIFCVKVNGQNIANETIADALEKLNVETDFNLQKSVKYEELEHHLGSNFESVIKEENNDNISNETSKLDKKIDSFDSVESKIVARKGVDMPLSKSDHVPSVSARKGVSYPSSVIARKGVNFEDDLHLNSSESGMRLSENISISDNLNEDFNENTESTESQEDLKEAVTDEIKPIIDLNNDVTHKYEINDKVITKNSSNTDNTTNLNAPTVSPVSPHFIPTFSTFEVESNFSSSETLQNLDTTVSASFIPQVTEIEVGKSKNDNERGKGFRSNATNGAIVVTILILLSLIALVGFIGYKRLHAFWYRRHYARVDFLIDGMYD